MAICTFMDVINLTSNMLQKKAVVENYARAECVESAPSLKNKGFRQK
jgi:hypothetical protein